MLRARMDDIIKNSPFSEPIGGFLFGFSSTFIALVSFVLFLLIIYDYYRFNKNSFIVKLKYCFLGESEFVLPLYFKNNKVIEQHDNNIIELTEKPDLSSFVIPGINTEQIGLPMSPLSSSGLKRRTVSMNSFGMTGAFAPTSTPTKIQTPFVYDTPEKAHAV